jgi:hypothetical protein
VKLDAVKPENIEDTFTALSLGIVGEEAVGCTIVAN